MEYKYNTNIKFTLKDGTTLRYKLKKCYLECLDGYNASLFSKIGVDKYEFCKRFYAGSCFGSWPEFSDEDYSWIDTMIDALWDEYQVITTVEEFCRYHGISAGDKITIKYGGWSRTCDLYNTFVMFSGESNDVIFTEMGLDKGTASHMAYGYPSENAHKEGQWPESKNFPDLLKMLKYLSSKGAIIDGLPTTFSTSSRSPKDPQVSIKITVGNKKPIVFKYRI